MLHIAIVEDEESERARIREYLPCLEKTEGLAFAVTEFSAGTAFLGNYTPEYGIFFLLFMRQPPGPKRTWRLPFYNGPLFKKIQEPLKKSALRGR